jgi:hypothetical protein
MIRHPLLLSVISIDVISLLLVAAATVSALRIVTGGSPESAANGRIGLGGKAGTASIRGRAGIALLALSTFLLIFGIAGVLPKIVPGAMCGEGVLQATKGATGRALALRGLALGVLAVWHLLDRQNRSRPDSPLATRAARTLLLASPVVVLAVYDTFQAILRLDVNRPVDCCTAVYGKIRNMDSAGGAWSLPDAYWIGGLALGAIAIIFVGLHLWRTSRPLGARMSGLFCLVSILWVPVAATSLLRSFAAYHYRFPREPCAWCLFLPENKLVGYLLFGSLILVAVEACAAFICSTVATNYPALESATGKRTRAAGLRMALAAILFLALVGIPAIVWRLQLGFWIK